MMNMPQSNYRFERIEKKFWMSASQYEALLPTLDCYLVRDEYGESQICNIYYDTGDFALIRESIERPYFKEKLRLRSYGFPGEGDPVYVELKRKLKGIGYKRRIKIPFAEAKRLLAGQVVDAAAFAQATGADPQIAGELIEFLRRYRPEAAVLLTYQRYAMYGKENPNFRVTIDRKLRYRRKFPELMSNRSLLPIMEDDNAVLMEVKAEGAIPAWLTEEMSRLKIYQAPFSKVGFCYSKHIAPALVYDQTDRNHV